MIAFVVPLATAKPVVALLVELNHEYVNDPLPPVGVDPVSVVGAVLVQIVCAPLAVLVAITGDTVTCTAALVSEHPPELTNLLNQVVALRVDGE